jgi:hypothetical protein
MRPRKPPIPTAALPTDLLTRLKKQTEKNLKEITEELRKRGIRP